MRNNHLKPCPFCGNDVFLVAYTQEIVDSGVWHDVLEIECPNCGCFKLDNNWRHCGKRVKTCYDIWNSRVREVYRYDIHGEDDWSE